VAPPSTLRWGRAARVAARCGHRPGPCPLQATALHRPALLSTILELLGRLHRQARNHAQPAGLQMARLGSEDIRCSAWPGGKEHRWARLLGGPGREWVHIFG
jgi:hypothetical protein